MPRRHEYYYDDPHDLGYDRRRPRSTSRHRADGFVHALEQGRVHEAGDIAKSALMPRSEHRHHSHERGSRREHHGRRGENSLERTGERGHYTYDQDPDARPPGLRSADGHKKTTVTITANIRANATTTTTTVVNTRAREGLGGTGLPKRQRPQRRQA